MESLAKAICGSNPTTERPDKSVVRMHTTRTCFCGLGRSGLHEEKIQKHSSNKNSNVLKLVFKGSLGLKELHYNIFSSLDRYTVRLSGIPDQKQKLISVPKISSRGQEFPTKNSRPWL